MYSTKNILLYTIRTAAEFEYNNCSLIPSGYFKGEKFHEFGSLRATRKSFLHETEICPTHLYN